MSVNKTYLSSSTLIIAAFLAAPSLANGDGSNVNNIDLLRPSIDDQCLDPSLCKPNTQALEQNLSMPQDYQNTLSQNTLSNSDFSSPATTFDWSISLRGAFQNDHNGERFEIMSVPTLSVEHLMPTGQINIEASANLVQQLDDEFRFLGGNVNASANHVINRDTNITAGANLSLNQASLNDPMIADSIMTTPVTVSGDANVALAHRFGKLNGEIRASYARSTSGETQLIDETWQDNSPLDNTNIGAGLRLSYELTPIITAFVDGSVNRNIFDNDSLILLASQSSTSYALRAGLSGNWKDVITAQVSAGLGNIKYDSDILEDVPTTLLDANITYRNGKGLDINASFTSDVRPADPSSLVSTRVSYATMLMANYQINDWLVGRASVGAGWAQNIGLPDIERSFSAGVGADYILNKQTNISADYSFGTLETEALGKRESHRFELGVTFSRD